MAIRSRQLKRLITIGVTIIFVVEVLRLALVLENFDNFDDDHLNDARKSKADSSRMRNWKTSRWSRSEEVDGGVGYKEKLSDEEKKAEEEMLVKSLRRNEADEGLEVDGRGKLESRRDNNDGQIHKMESHEIRPLKNKFVRESTQGSVVNNDESDVIYVNMSRPIINPHLFRYTINSEDVCKDRKVFLFCYVHTAVDHFKRRKRIRQTWGNQSNYPGVEIRVMFFVGLPNPNDTYSRLNQDYLEFESKRYHDIVQEDFIDTYRNLSHKGIGALKWVSTYCNQASYVLKTDDDMFVSMHIILNHLQNLYKANYRNRLLMCYVFYAMHVDRQNGQWSLPKDYFPDDLYPPYCSGMGFVMTVDVATAMYRVSPFVRFLWVDDAFISGVLPAALDGAVNHTTWMKTYCGAFEMGIYTHPTEWYKYTFTHVHDEDLYLKTWNGLTDILRNRTIPQPSVIRPGHLADEYIPLIKLFSLPP